MKITKEATDFIKQWEGLSLDAYRCPAGRWTIGYGHTRTARPGMRITAAEADALLQQDLERTATALRAMTTVPLTSGQAAALLSWVFNVGAWAAAGSTLIKKLNDGHYRAVPEQLRRWVFVNGKKSKGLINRREAEIKLWNRRET